MRVATVGDASRDMPQESEVCSVSKESGPNSTSAVSLLSVVIPCHNEQGVVEETHRRLSNLFADWKQQGKLRDGEIVFVDDGSRDDTLAILERLAAGDPAMRVVSLSRNFGHQAALVAGLAHAAGDAIVTIDADLQDPPEVIGDMLDRFREGYDVVYGVRSSRATDTVMKRATARGFYKFSRAMGVDLIYDHADYRMISRAVRHAFLQYQETNLFIRGIFPAMGFKHTSVTYDRAERFAGETKYPFRKMMAFALEGITSFSRKPLRIAFSIGVLVFVGSVAACVWAVIAKVTGRAIPGWLSTVLPLYVFMGLQMIFLGILGEYLGKVYMETKRRPRFLVRRLINVSHPESTDAADDQARDHV
jgi:glycosyltransferase involved in cell wall biosynthesis